MRYKLNALAISLLGSALLCADHLPSRASALRPSPATTARQKGKEQTGAADAKRDEGRSKLRRGEAGESLILLEDALKLYALAGDKQGQAATHDLIGELYEQQGRYDAALEHFQAAHKLYAALSGKAHKHNANLMLAKIGSMHYRQEDLAAAARAYGQMKVEKPGSKSKGWLGLVEGTAVGATSDNRGVQVGAPTAGALLSAKDQFERYRRTIIYAGYHIGLGRIDFQLRQFDSAEKHFKEALSATTGDLPGIRNLGQTRRFRIAARTGLGDAALAERRFDKAVDYYDEAAHDAVKEKRLDLAWPAQKGRGRSLWLQAGQPKEAKKSGKLKAEALSAYRDALKSVEGLRAGSLRADEARTVFLATTRDVFEEASAALAEMALAAAPDAGKPLEGQALDYAAEAFRVAEQGRARSLLDLLTEAGGNISEGVPPEIFRRKQKNLERQAEIAELLLGTSSTDKPPSAERLEKELDNLQNEEVSIENEIRAASPRYKDLTSTEPLTLAQAQQQLLDDQTALLEYSLGSEASYLWVVTKQAVVLFRLPPRAELNRQADDLRRSILPLDSGRSILGLTAEEKERGLRVTRQGGSLPAADFNSASHKLFKTILEEALRVVGSRRLVIVPDGALSFVPFEALVSSPQGTDYATLAYLLKTNETVYAPSASVAAALRRVSGNASASFTGILLIADPVFDTGDVRAKNVPAASSPPAERGLSLKSGILDVARPGTQITTKLEIVRLPGTRDEANQIAQTAGAAGLKADKWLDLDASEANAKERDLRAYRILHIATHGLLDAKRPQFSGVVLSLVGNTRGHDGFLRTDEIFNLRLGSPLVMLSACQTGLGKEQRGEGVMGLSRAFMYAGAPLVGVTLWSVEDKPTADLMSDFYKNLLTKDGPSAAAALRIARQNMISGRKFSAPFYWAPFVLIGYSR